MVTPLPPLRHKILLVDDDQDILDLYFGVLTELPSQPEIHTASSGGRALALLESASFTLLIVDLNMPKMDGLQVLAIARRKYPQLRLVVLTAVVDEQFRARAYAMGVDQFWQKPDSAKEIQLFRESIDALLQREAQGGFRGVQSKSLVDIIQLECLSQSSAVLKVNNGILEGRIWLQNGILMDAEAQELKGEAAFRWILGWKTGSFELLPADPTRPKNIATSYQGLLLESAQALDEAVSEAAEGNGRVPVSDSALYSLTRFEGVQFVMSMGPAPQCDIESWGLESPEPVADWMHHALEQFSDLSERLQMGELHQITGMGTQTNIAFAPSHLGELCVGLRPNLCTAEVRESMKNITAKWTS